MNDLRFAFRQLRKSPGFTVIAVLTLALGIGANSAIFSVVNGLLLKPFPYPDADRLAVLWLRSPGISIPQDWPSPGQYIDIQNENRSFSEMSISRGRVATLIGAGLEGTAQRAEVLETSSTLFPLLGATPLRGRLLRPDEDKPGQPAVVILSHGFWTRVFGADPAVIGKTITLNGLGGGSGETKNQYEVVGVLGPDFLLNDEIMPTVASIKQMDIFLPLPFAADAVTTRRGDENFNIMARTRPGVTMAQAKADVLAIAGRIREKDKRDRTFTIDVVPLVESVVGDVRRAVLVLLGSVSLVLLIACANVANLLLTRATSRQKEVAVRTALGASWQRLVRQLLTESLMLSVTGAALGVTFARIAVGGLVRFAPVTLPRLDHVAIDARVLPFTAAVALVTGVLFGLVPALRGASAGLQQTLATDSRTSVGGSSRAQSALVVADIVLALVLLAGAGLMLRTVVSLTRTSPGFVADGVLTLQYSLVGQAYAEDAAVVSFQDRTLEKIRALPGVASAALTDQVPFGGNYDCRGFHAKGRMKPNTVDDPCLERYGVTSDYLRVMGIPLLRGRFVSSQDVATSQPVIVVSEATAKLVWGNDDPIGSEVRFGNAEKGTWYTVVGVVGDVHHEDVTQPVTAAFYHSEAQFTDSYLVALVKASNGDPATLGAAVRQVLRELDPTVPVYQVDTLPALVEQASAQRLFVMRLLAGFALVAVLLAAIGLYGVVSYGVSQRTREMGVRVALGAQRRDVMRLVLSSGFVLVAVGLVLGLAAAIAATRFMDALVFGVSPVDPPTFLGAAGVLTIVALAAHWVPVRRALRIDPAQALRAE